MYGSTVTHIHLFGVVLCVNCLIAVKELFWLFLFEARHRQKLFTSQNSEGNRKIFGGNVN